MESVRERARPESIEGANYGSERTDCSFAIPKRPESMRWRFHGMPRKHWIVIRRA